MTRHLADIVARSNTRRLALVGLTKNVGKTTTTNHLLAALIDEGFFQAGELALTSLGLDGEAVDALTGLAKPRYVPQPGVLVATTVDLLRQAEQEGMQVERLAQLAGRTALGPVVLARVLRPGRIVVAGPALLRDLRSALDRMQQYGARLSIVDGAINRLGAASPGITGACILCTGASLAATPELVARRTADILARLMVQPSRWKDAYRQRYPQARLLVFSSDSDRDESAEVFRGSTEPAAGAQWIVARMLTHQQPVFLLRGAFTEELSRELLAQLSRHTLPTQAEIVVGDGTKIFCHSVVLQRLAARSLHLRVAEPVRILALSINPYTPEYTCTPQRLLDALARALPAPHPPIIDVVSGLHKDGFYSGVQKY